MLDVLENVDCVSWDRAAAVDMATIDPALLACNTPLLVKALCINLPAHDQISASLLVRRTIDALWSSISMTWEYKDDPCDIGGWILSW